jgi:proteasome beta subunit
MNGDFLALLPEGPFASLKGLGSAPVSGSPHPSFTPLEATTVFAFHCAEGVVIAGDHRATAGNTIFSDKTEKILELDAHSAMAIAGSPAVAFEMARTLQTTFEFYRRSQLQSMSLPAKIRALSKLLRDNLPATLQGIGAVAPIFVGMEASDPKGAPAIYYYDPMGAQFEATNYASSGSGSHSIRSVLHFLEMWGSPRPKDMNIEQATTLTNRLLMTAAEFDTATGGVQPDRKLFATIKLLNRDGMKTILSEEHELYWGKAQA